jgi:hypothetical protein
VHIGQAEGAQVFARLVVQAAQALYAVDLGGQLRQHRSLVAATRTDFEHAPELAVGAGSALA